MACMQLRSYIAKNYSPEELEALIAGRLPPCPANYVPPKGLAADMSARSSTRQRRNSGHPVAGAEDDSMEVGLTAAHSQVAPRQGRSDWTRLMGLVDEQAQTAEPDVRYDNPYSAAQGESPGRRVGSTYKESLNEDRSFYPPAVSLDVGRASQVNPVQLPVIPPFTSIASAAPMHNPVKDAFEVLGKVPSHQHRQSHLKSDRKKKRGEASAHIDAFTSCRNGTVGTRKQQNGSQATDALASLVPYDDENSLAGHSLGGFISSPQPGQHMFGVFHDGDSCGAARRGEIMGGDSLSQLLTLDWEEGSGGANGWDDFSHGAGSGGLSVCVEPCTDGFGNPSILRGGSKKTKTSTVARHKQKKNKTKTGKAVRKKVATTSNKHPSPKADTRHSTDVPSAAVVSVATLDHIDASGFATSEYELKYGNEHPADHSLLPVSDEFSMM